MTRAAYFSSGDHLNMGQLMRFCSVGSAAGWAAAPTMGKVRTSLPVTTSQTATLLPTSSSVKGDMGELEASIGRGDHVTR